MAKIKVGVIGLGVMGTYHANIYSRLKEATLAGVFDPILERAQELSSQLNCPFFPTLDELLKAVSAVSIVSPTSHHYEIAQTCINHNLHCLIEKPICLTSQQASELVDLSNNKGVVLAVGMIEKFNPVFKKVLSLVKHETILGIDFKRFSPFPARISDASVVLDMMLHDIDLALAFTMSGVSSLKAAGKKVNSTLPDEAQVSLFFKDGLIARIEASRVKPDKYRAIIVTTDKAIYNVDLLNKKLFRRDYNSIIEKTSVVIKPEDPLTLELSDFLISIAQKRKPKTSGAEALSSLKIAEEVESQIC